MNAALVLAHGGGAPEAAMVALPLVLIAVFVVLERRARQREQEQEGPGGTVQDDDRD